MNEALSSDRQRAVLRSLQAEAGEKAVEVVVNQVELMVIVQVEVQQGKGTRYCPQESLVHPCFFFWGGPFFVVVRLGS